MKKIIIFWICLILIGQVIGGYYFLRLGSQKTELISKQSKVNLNTDLYINDVKIEDKEKKAYVISSIKHFNLGKNGEYNYKKKLDINTKINVDKNIIFKFYFDDKCKNNFYKIDDKKYISVDLEDLCELIMETK